MVTLDETELEASMGLASGDAEALPASLTGLLSEAFDALSAQIAIVDGSSRILAVNDSWLRFVAEHEGPPVRTGLGETYLALCSTLGLDGASAEQAARGVREVLDGSRARFELDVSCARPDGERLLLHLRVSPIGCGSHAVVAHEDVTSRSQLAHEARQRAALLDNLSEAIVATRPDWTVTSWNRAAERIFARSQQDVVAQDLREVALGDVSGGFDAIERELALHGHATVESTLRRGDGSFFRALGSLAKVSAEDGSPLGFVGVFRDNTELEELRVEMHHAQKMEAVGRLAAGIAHDFNNLLMGLSGVSDLGLRKTRDPVARDMLAEVKRAADGGSEIVEQLMAFARPDPRLRDPALADEVVRELAPMLEGLLGADVRVVVELDADGHHVSLDAGYLRQILLNLAINSRDAMPRGGRLRIATARCSIREGDRRRAAGEYVRLTVEDDGIGMDDETRGHVFEPFFTTKEPGTGTGLGLSTVYGLVRQHNGAIALRSAPGQGARFDIDLPVAEPPAVTGDRAARAEVDVEGGGATVLVVEDDSLVRMTVCTFLEDAGYRVLEAAGSDDVARVLEEAGPIDVVLTDMVLPGIAGPEVVRRVRERHPSARPLFMSAYSRELLTERGMLSSDERTLQKPFDETTLEVAMRDVLSKHSAAEDERAATRAGRHTVLLVEDYQLARGAMRELLEDEGYRVLEAASLRDARALAHEKIDLLLTDLGLGDGRGDVLAEELRRVIPGLGVLYVTGQSATDKRVQQALTQPRTRHLQKPVDLDVLAAAVEALLQS